MKLKIGIIGCGMITKERHAPEYYANENCKVVGFYDKDISRAQAMAEKYGGVVCESVDELLSMDLDAVSVCVANAMHAEITIQALNAGKHVLCEKPMAVTLEQCEAMVEAAERNGKILMIGHNQRFAAAHQEARRLIQDGAIGKVLSFETKFGHGGPEFWTKTPDTWFFHKSQAAFGVMADLGIHKTDLDGTLIDVDDNSFCFYQTESGVTGIMHVSWTFYGNEKNSTVIYGTKGVLRCYDDETNALIWERKDGGIVRFDLGYISKNSDATLGVHQNTGVIDEFVDSILNQREPLTSARESLKAMRVIFAALESARTGEKITVQQE